MAKMVIGIINPLIDLISKVTETSNDCTSVFNFVIKSTPYTDVTISATSSTNLDEYLSMHQVNPTGSRGGGSRDSLKNLQDGSIIRTDSQGNANIRLIFDNFVTVNSNSETNACNTVNITISDAVNNRTESRDFTRCGGVYDCDDYPNPVAEDDMYDVSIGGFKVLPIMENDDVGSSFTTAIPTIVTQPSYGTVQVLPSGEVKYTHTGTTDTTDTFTYFITNEIGQESNTATVTINFVEKVIDNNTIVNIFFDKTGSMSETLDKLRLMRENGGALYTKISPYYDSDTEYFNKVKIHEFDSERTFLALSDKINSDGKTINLVFQDEAYPTYHGLTYDGWSINDPRRKPLEDDIVILRDRIQNINETDFNAVLFEITSDNIDGEGFHKLFKAVKETDSNNAGSYTGEFNISDINNIEVVYNVKEGEDPQFSTDEEAAQYYADLIEGALQELGFSI